MKKTILAVTAVCAMFSAVVTAQDTCVNINKREGWHSGQVLPGTGDVSFSFKNPGMFRSKEMIKIDPAKKYVFSGEVRKNPNAPTAMFYPGFELFDKDKKLIDGLSVSIISGTATTMTKAAKAGDTMITVKNGVRWLARSWYYVAFNAGPLPHREFGGAVKAVKRAGNVWNVTLSKPLTKDYPAGTKVRLQGMGGYFYVGNCNPGDAWKTFGSNIIHGVSTDRVVNGKFWPGTVYARPFVQANWNWGAKERNKFETALKNVKAGVIK